jgi:hypothetical protein
VSEEEELQQQREALRRRRDEQEYRADVAERTIAALREQLAVRAEFSTKLLDDMKAMRQLVSDILAVYDPYGLGWQARWRARVEAISPCVL